MKYLLMILMIVFLLVANQARADFMNCTKGNVYEGDWQAELVMKCGPPLQVIAAQPIMTVESEGNQGSGRSMTVQWYIYPFGNGRVYYLKIQDNRIISIDTGSYGTIPK